ncbi:Indole-3-glycerol phosphate synthase [Clostridiales bacterium CHKCI001]|nr:Indole-3-glycerol phosphate synthase [Clostridiales bacterium CHKCI001]
MILDELAAYSKLRVEQAKQQLSLEAIKANAMQLPKGDFRFEQTLSKPEVSFICEVKKASPSKGIIAKQFPYREIARQYEEAGADAISVLTEPKWFLGSDQYLSEIRKEVSLPILRKDFTVDAYQIYEAKLLGADAVLLICAILDTKTIHNYLQICEELGLSAIVEAHDEVEIASAIEAGAKIIGVNNRNLKNFTVNFQNCTSLRKYIPENILFVAESGVKTAEDVASIANAGANAILIGETLMRSNQKKELLHTFRKASQNI